MLGADSFDHVCGTFVGHIHRSNGRTSLDKLDSSSGYRAYTPARYGGIAWCKGVRNGQMVS